MRKVFERYCRRLNGCDGAVYIELVLSLGIIFALFISSIDLANMLDTRGRMSVLTREITNDAFKSCTDSSTLGTCLQEVRKRHFEFARAMGLAKNSLADAIDPMLTPSDVPRDADFEIILSFYSCASHPCSGDCSATASDSSCSCQCNDPQLLAMVPNPDAIDPLLRPEFESRYELPIIEEKFSEALNGRGAIAISEVVSRQEGITSLTDQKVIYEESLF